MMMKELLKLLFVPSTFVASEIHEKRERQSGISKTVIHQPASSSTLHSKQVSPEDRTSARLEAYTEDTHSERKSKLLFVYMHLQSYILHVIVIVIVRTLMCE